ncbi:MAG: hypothetical protein Q8Q23_06665 [bacterium]|nr:hypothetical protein [bacterium]
MPKIPEHDNFIVDLRQQKPAMRSKRNQSEAEQFLGGVNIQNESSGRQPGWLNFVKYNNGFLLIIVIGVALFSSLAMASEEVRDNTIGAKQVYAEGVDNALLLAADLGNFNMDFTITGIIEDSESFTITYSYVDLGLINDVWQYLEKQSGRRINKPFRKDLGLYLAQELSEEASARLKELKAEQKKAQEAGETKVIQITEYSGLIGKVLNASTKIFPEYQPVKKIEIASPLINERARDRAQLGRADNLTNVYQDWVNDHPEEIANLDQDLINGNADANSSTTAEVIDSGAAADRGAEVSEEPIVPSAIGETPPAEAEEVIFDAPVEGSAPEAVAEPVSAPAEAPEQTAEPAIEMAPPATVE